MTPTVLAKYSSAGKILQSNITKLETKKSSSLVFLVLLHFSTYLGEGCFFERSFG